MTPEQLSEGLTKEKTQLCSNTLIIYCSAAHVTVHHHLDCSSGLKRSLPSITEHDSVLPDTSFTVACRFTYWKGRMRQGRRMTDPPFLFFFWLGSGHFKFGHLFRMSLCDNPLFMLLQPPWINLNSMGF